MPIKVGLRLGGEVEGAFDRLLVNITEESTLYSL